MEVGKSSHRIYIGIYHGGVWYVETLLVNSEISVDSLPSERQLETESKHEGVAPTEHIKLIPSHGLSFFTKTAQE